MKDNEMIKMFDKVNRMMVGNFPKKRSTWTYSCRFDKGNDYQYIYKEILCGDEIESAYIEEIRHLDNGNKIILKSIKVPVGFNFNAWSLFVNSNRSKSGKCRGWDNI